MQKNPEQMEQQLDMGFREPFSNKMKKAKYRIVLFFIKLRTNSLFRSPTLWILPLMTISLLAVQYYYYHNYFAAIPQEIPLLNIRDDLGLRLLDKDYLFWILILSMVLTFVSIVISIKNYYQFKILSIMILGNTFLAMCLITIAYIRIFGIYIF